MWRLMIMVTAFAVACAITHRNKKGELSYNGLGPAGLSALDHGVQVAEEVATGDIDGPVYVEVVTRQGSVRVNSGYPGYYGAMPYTGGWQVDQRYAAGVQANALREAMVAASVQSLPVLSMPGSTVSAPAAPAAAQTRGWTLPECPKDRDPGDLEEAVGCHDKDLDMLFELHKSAE